MAVINGCERAAEYRAIDDRGVHHAGQAHVETEHRRTIHLFRRIQPPDRRSDDPEVLRVLELDILRHRHFRGRFGELAITRAAISRCKHDLAILRMTRRWIALPLLRRCRHEHHARGRAGLAHRLPCIAHGSRAARQLTTQERVREERFIGRRMIDRDVVERHVQFFGDQHGQRGIDALPHFDFRHDEHDLAALVDLHEGIRREHAFLRRLDAISANHGLALALILTRGGQAEADQQAAARSDARRHAELEESTARKPCARRVTPRFDQSLRHVTPPSRPA